jgi:hypothetical protein
MSRFVSDARSRGGTPSSSCLAMRSRIDTRRSRGEPVRAAEATPRSSLGTRHPRGNEPCVEDARWRVRASSSTQKTDGLRGRSQVGGRPARTRQASRARRAFISTAQSLLQYLTMPTNETPHMAHGFGSGSERGGFGLRERTTFGSRITMDAQVGHHQRSRSPVGVVLFRHHAQYISMCPSSYSSRPIGMTRRTGPWSHRGSSGGGTSTTGSQPPSLWYGTSSARKYPLRLRRRYGLSIRSVRRHHL